MYSFLLFFLFQKENEMQSTMEEVFLRFPHLSENIFGSLKSEFLAKSKEVCRSWYDYLDDQKFLQIRADKVKLVIETVEKFEHIPKDQQAYYEIPNTTFEIETKKAIINCRATPFPTNDQLTAFLFELHNQAIVNKNTIPNIPLSIDRYE